MSGLFISERPIMKLTISMVAAACAVAVTPLAAAAASSARRCWTSLRQQGLALGANTLTSLIPTMYNALDVVSREMVGFIPAVTSRHDLRARRGRPDRAVARRAGATASDITPGVTPPNDGDQTIGNISMTLTKARRVPVRWNGEEKKGWTTTAPATTPSSAQFAQAMRTLVNEVESDLAALHINASRAAGTAGTAPFGTAGDLSDTAGVLRILETTAPRAWTSSWCWARPPSRTCAASSRCCSR
jgi:hypothetical protein